MTILEDLGTRKRPAFASNCNGRIVAWNDSAEQLLGYSGADMIGRHCFEVLDGKDVFGNRFCHERCAIRCMIRRDEPISHWQLNYRTASSDRIRVSVSAIAVNGNSPQDSLVVHLLEPVLNGDGESTLDIPRRPGKRLPAAGQGDTDTKPVELTAREREILQLLASGSTTAEMVCHLCISADTVRTHVRNILHKLNAHSRLEAVCTAIRKQLV